MTKKFSRISFATFAVAILLSTVGCTGKDSPTIPALIALLAGTWDVTAVVTGGNVFDEGETFKATVTLTQEGNLISGNWESEEGDFADVEGKVDGQRFTFQFQRLVEGCNGTFSGDLTVADDNRSMAGTLRAVGCGLSIDANAEAKKH